MKWKGIREDSGYRLIRRDFKYRGKVVSVSQDHFRFPDGHEARHDVLHLPPAVAIVPLLDDGRGGTDVVLVEQFRNSVEGYIHEVPAGILEEGEEPAACAARVLEEETGYVASRLTHLATLLPIPGTSAHLMHFYVAEGLSPGRQQLEASECLTVKRVPLEALVDAVLGCVTAPEGSGAPCGCAPTEAPVIVDAKTHIAILHVALRRTGKARAAGGGP